MRKIFKKIAAIAMASVMAASMAVSANATSESCSHPATIRSRTGFANHYNSAHKIKVYGTNGTSREETCSISGSVYYCSYVCTTCNAIVGSAGTDTEEAHYNSLCPQYSF